MRFTLSLTVAALAVFGPLSASAQTAAPQAATVPANAPEPRPADVATLDGLMAALYETVSGPAGPRDWDRLRSLFRADATMIGSGRRADGSLGARVRSVEGYIDATGPHFAAEPFFESEIGREVHDTGGPIVHVFSAYATKHSPDGEPFARGVNSLQLFHDGQRWWILSIAWASETPETPIPARLISGG